jgi:hypothetical protein
MRDGRGFLVWEDALHLVRQTDRAGDAETLVSAGFVHLPFPLPGMLFRSGGGDVVRSVLAPVLRVRPSEGGRSLERHERIVLPAHRNSELVVLEFKLRGTEVSGSPYRMAYVHVAATRAGESAVLGDGVDPTATRHRTRTAGEEGNASLVRHYFEMLGAGAFERIDALRAPGYVDRARSESGGNLYDAERFMKANPGGGLTIDTLIAERELVAARTTVRVTRDGAVDVTSGMTFFRVVDGKLVERWCCHPSET